LKISISIHRICKIAKMIRRSNSIISLWLLFFICSLQICNLDIL